MKIKHFVNKIICEDSLKVMSQMPENSVSNIVCDPPYGLGFMGKDWDKGVPPKVYWQEALRVAKPGAYLLAFGGTRTHHHLMIAIENSGWQIRDCMMWLYGSGFPKSYNISKGIDKKLGRDRKIIGKQNYTMPQADNSIQANSYGISGNTLSKNIKSKRIVANITKSCSDKAKLFDGYGTALKPAYEIIIVAMKPLNKSYVNNALTHGISGMNIDGSRIGLNAGWSYPNGAGGFCSHSYQSTSDIAKAWNFRTVENNKPVKSTKGRFPANILLSHHNDCIFLGTKRIKGVKSQNPHQASATNKIRFNASKIINRRQVTDNDGFEEVEEWNCSTDCPIRILDIQSGITKSRANRNYKFNNVSCGSEIFSGRGIYVPRSDKGGASRFFYCSKASRKERNINLPNGIKNRHPTVKPQKLMQYLIKLIAPPQNGIILDPFCGSGSTLVACKKLKIDFIGIDNDPESIKIAKYRLKK